MSALKDFVQKEARRWVAQEFAKVRAANARQRLNSELRMIAFASKQGGKYPIALQAHRDLAQKIKTAFGL